MGHLKILNRCVLVMQFLAMNIFDGDFVTFLHHVELGFSGLVVAMLGFIP